MSLVIEVVGVREGARAPDPVFCAVARGQQVKFGSRG